MAALLQNNRCDRQFLFLERRKFFKSGGDRGIDRRLQRLLLRKRTHHREQQNEYGFHDFRWKKRMTESPCFSILISSRAAGNSRVSRLVCPSTNNPPGATTAGRFG